MPPGLPYCRRVKPDLDSRVRAAAFEFLSVRHLPSPARRAARGGPHPARRPSAWRAGRLERSRAVQAAPRRLRPPHPGDQAEPDGGPAPRHPARGRRADAPPRPAGAQHQEAPDPDRAPVGGERVDEGAGEDQRRAADEGQDGSRQPCHHQQPDQDVDGDQSPTITPSTVSTARSMRGRSMLGWSSAATATIAGSSGRWMKPTRGRRAAGSRCRRPSSEWSVQ